MSNMFKMLVVRKLSGDGDTVEILLPIGLIVLLVLIGLGLGWVSAYLYAWGFARGSQRGEGITFNVRR